MSTLLQKYEVGEFNGYPRPQGVLVEYSMLPKATHKREGVYRCEPGLILRTTTTKKRRRRRRGRGRSQGEFLNYVAGGTENIDQNEDFVQKFQRNIVDGSLCTLDERSVEVLVLEKMDVIRYMMACST